MIFRGGISQGFRGILAVILKEELVQVSEGFKILFEGGISPCLGGIRAAV